MSRTWAGPVFPLPSLDGGRSDGHGSEIVGGLFSFQMLSLMIQVLLFLQMKVNWLRTQMSSCCH